eukprot:CAMPEP_0168615212 /NCGR_PEP_ID=MMETSP0449_2-20121227/4386_1 /TAXON_ID=1082188 /ORGANISM="Strombidium rassoulzadegani, Strain ras09" /LENGTH=92 /DNA_ID=CAMNT_0008655941 /DNA_START=131 /DNA_END=409 /DNA_ORIENTATION=+
MSSEGDLRPATGGVSRVLHGGEGAGAGCGGVFLLLLLSPGSLGGGLGCGVGGASNLAVVAPSVVLAGAVVVGEAEAGLASGLVVDLDGSLSL